MKRTLVMLIALFLMASSLRAQLPYAAALRILHSGVDIRRVNTQAWLPLMQYAEMPVGAGDRLRLNQEGRALITFASGADMLLLPYSQLELVAFEQEAGGDLALHARFTGQGVIAVSPETTFSAFSITMPHAVITQPAQHFALQADTDHARVISAAGVVEIDAADQRIRVEAGDGVRLTAGSVDYAASLDSPMHFARLDSALDGCQGTARATERDSVNIRQGPGNGYAVIGEFLNGAEVIIMGMTPDGERYRVLFLSGFGWVVANGIVNACAGLPVYAYDTLEQVISVHDISDDDERLLTPFFGTWRDDYRFYPLNP